MSWAWQSDSGRRSGHAISVRKGTRMARCRAPTPDGVGGGDGAQAGERVSTWRPRSELGAAPRAHWPLINLRPWPRAQSEYNNPGCDCSLCLFCIPADSLSTTSKNLTLFKVHHYDDKLI